MKISLNTDIGEGFGAWRIADDQALLGLVTDANVACGFHAGDPSIMRETCRIAAVNAVSVGAQVGYRDLEGFGRRFIEVPPRVLTNEVIYQLGALDALGRVEGSGLTYVKVHGALYHAAVQHERFADAIIGAVLSYDASLPVLCQPGTSFATAAEGAGLPIFREGFIDRAYRADGLLVPRDAPGAVITDPEAAAERAVRLAHGEVETIDGEVIELQVDSLCIHSDSPGAVGVATAVRRALVADGVALAGLRRPSA